MRRWSLTASLMVSLVASSAQADDRRDPRLALARGDGERPIVITLDPAAVTRSGGGSVHVEPHVLSALVDAGVTPSRARDGGLLGWGSAVAAHADHGAVSRVLASPFVARVAPDGSPISLPRPLDHTAALVGADRVRASEGVVDFGITGRGVVVCNIDAGIDVFHPSFFNADGGFFGWRDVNGNGELDPGGDEVELDGERVTLRSLNGIVSHFADDVPLFDTQLSMIDLRYDYFYADLDGDLRRDAGRGAGFTDASPSLGEPLFVGDDVNGNGRIDAGEKIVRLGTSKVRALRVGDAVYRRGENLIDAPWTADMQHGNGAAGILVGGQAGLAKLVGIAPDADLVVAANVDRGQEFAMTTFCLDEGARVVLHEYAPWIGESLDGSSELEALIDATAKAGVSHVNPAGNLSGARKSAKLVLEEQGSVLPLDLPNDGAHAVALTFLWRDAERSLAFELVDALGQRREVQPDGVARWWAGRMLQAIARTSDRGTRSVDVYVWSTEALPHGRWEVAVEPADAGGPTELVAFAWDDRSGWRPGFAFEEHVSEEHLIGWPGTADLGLAVAAYRGHAFDEPVPEGQRAEYSGRGRRIDGAPLLALAAPDNPIVPGRFDDRELSYIIYGGTSGASPHVAGAAALLLSEEPSLDGPAIKARLIESARADEATGLVPNDDFGFGKLDVYRAVTGASLGEGEAPTIEEHDYLVPVGELTALPIFVSDADDEEDALRVEVDLDYDGSFDQTLVNPWVTVFVEEHGLKLVKVRATDPSGRQSSALMRIRTNAPSAVGVDPDGDATFDVAGGCRAADAPAGRKGGWGVAGLVVGLALSRRRRAQALRGSLQAPRKN